MNKPNREIDRVFIHCSASSYPDHDDIEVIRGWHTSPPNNWSDVGYHYYIQFDGTLQIGIDIERTPAAQRGQNVGTIAICLSGLKEDDFTAKQFRTLRYLCNSINNAIPNVTFHGHNEVANKECPVFNYREVLGLDDYGEFIGPSNLTPISKEVWMSDNNKEEIHLFVEDESNNYIVGYNPELISWDRLKKFLEGEIPDVDWEEGKLESN